MLPRSPEAARLPRADLAACAAMLRGGSRTFFAASLVLPRAVREPATALYAFCRIADDAVDLCHGAGQDAAVSLARLRERLDRVYAGRPLPLPADRAMARVVARFAIPRALPEALIEGFEWDAAGRRYEDLSELTAYAARVAGAVGAMMAVLMGVREPEVVARACDLGVAMQFTNIARDVGEDARAGRLYLPRRWMREAGIDPDSWLARPVFSEALGTVIQRLLRAADVFYDRAEAGIAHLPARCRPGIHAARCLYAEIGREVERRGLDSVSCRAVVPLKRKLWGMAGAVAAAIPVPAVVAGACAETRFLVHAVVSASPRPPQPFSSSPTRVPPWWNLRERAIWVLDLFERLERRERIARSMRA